MKCTDNLKKTVLFSGVLASIVFGTLLYFTSYGHFGYQLWPLKVETGEMGAVVQGGSVNDLLS